MGHPMVLASDIRDAIMGLDVKFGPWAKRLMKERARAFVSYRSDRRPPVVDGGHDFRDEWRVELPDWCLDQRNQMTGPADNAALVSKMLSSGAQGVMLDLEDSVVNETWNITTGIANAVEALHGRVTSIDDRGFIALGQRSDPRQVVSVRPRGLHLQQQVPHMLAQVPASLYDVASVALQLIPDKLSHAPVFYIPKSESAQEALWWRELFRDIADIKGWPSDYIRCMALVESFPMAFQMDEFIYNLRDHILGLNLGRWDYMASVLHWHLDVEGMLFPDRNSIPHDVSFFQELRKQVVRTCHMRGILAIGGMTALFPDRRDPAANGRALEALRADKENEAALGFDGAWTGHPDQGAMTASSFPVPNQLHVSAGIISEDALVPGHIPGKCSLDGTRDAVRACILYRYGISQGRGASLIDGYMEDLATDRVYRLMLAQRIQRSCDGTLDDDHSLKNMVTMFNEEANAAISSLDAWSDIQVVKDMQEAATQALDMVFSRRF